MEIKEIWRWKKLRPIKIERFLLKISLSFWKYAKITARLIIIMAEERAFRYNVSTKRWKNCLRTPNSKTLLIARNSTVTKYDSLTAEFQRQTGCSLIEHRSIRPLGKANERNRVKSTQISDETIKRKTFKRGGRDRGKAVQENGGGRWKSRCKLELSSFKYSQVH